MSAPPTLNVYQYQDLLARSQDHYANTKYEILHRHLAGRRGLHVLNAGCGSGELSLQLAAAGHRVLGIDPSPEYIELARANAARAGVGRCTFRVSSIEDFVADEPFDCVTATDVLEHIEDDRRAFAGLVKMVKPGGLILITVPAGQWLYGSHDEALGHYRRYSRSSLLRLVSPLCDVEAVRYFGFSLIPVCLLFSKLMRRPYPVEESGSPRRPFVSLALRSLLRVDRMLPLPTGTSLILKATPRPAA